MELVQMLENLEHAQPVIIVQWEQLSLFPAQREDSHQ